MFVRVRPAQLLIASLCLVISGCYTTRAIPAGGGDAGQRVVVTLTEQGSVQMMPVIGADALSIDGRLVEANAELLVLSVISVQHPAGGVRWNGERVPIGRSAIGTIVEKRLNRPRTALLIGSAIAAAAIGADQFIDIGPSDGGDGGGSPVPGQ